MKGIVVFGTGGFAREVQQLLEDWISQNRQVDQDIPVLGFLDENESTHGQKIHGYDVLGGIDWLKENSDVGIVIGIGNPETKEKIIKSIKKVGDFKFPIIIHSSAVIGEYIKIDEGSIICAGNILTTDIEVGKFVTLNLNCTIGHDVVINDYVTIAPGVNVSGNVNVGRCTDLGTNSVIIQGKKIGEHSILGAGAVVVKDLPSYTTSVGNPAKVIKERKLSFSQSFQV